MSQTVLVQNALTDPATLRAAADRLRLKATQMIKYDMAGAHQLFGRERDLRGKADRLESELRTWEPVS